MYPLANKRQMHQPTLVQMFGGKQEASKCVERTSKRKTTKEIMEDIFGSSADEQEDFNDLEVQESEDFDDPEVQESEDELLFDMENLGEEPQAATSAGTAESKAMKEKKKTPVRKFCDEWARRYPFLKHVVRGKDEFMKCAWCEKYKLKGPWGKGSGCRTIMISAIRKHRKSKEHTWAATRFCSENGIQLPTHMEKMTNRNSSRVITVMKLAYFNAKEDLALRKFEKLCNLAYALGLDSMPVQKDYSSYTNRIAGKSFMLCISEHLRKIQLEEMRLSPFYGVTVDESTDRSLEKHLIVYIYFLPQAGKGICKIEFARLVIVPDGCAQTKFDALCDVLANCGLDLHCMVGIATDGDSSMLGCNDGMVTKLKRQIPHLLSIHCIAHREALAVVDAAKKFDCLAYIDKIANKIYTWISSSSLRHTGFQDLLQEMNLQVLEVLQIHAVRWLARGNVMSRLTQLMPAILSMWQDGAASWYRKLKIYKVLFCIHMLADVLHDMNMLSKHFQADIIDVCSINTAIDVTMSSLRRKFLQREFGKGTIFLKKFMDDTESGVLQHVNEEGKIYAHYLSYERIPGVDKNGIALDPFPGDVASCVAFAQMFVEKMIDCLNDRFPDICLFNAVKLFSPLYYPRDVKKPRDSSEREKKVSLWLDQLLERFGHSIIDAQGCKDELLSFTDTLYYGCEGMTMLDAWRAFSSNPEWQNTYPNMMKLWQVLLVILASSVSCERGFSKQNLIKTNQRQCLDVQTLDALMRVSLLGPNVNDIDWAVVHDLWANMKARRVCEDL